MPAFDINIIPMEILKNNIRKIMQLFLNLRIVLKIQGRLITLLMTEILLTNR